MIDHFNSKRLHMRPLAVSDAEALHAAYADEGVMRWGESGPHTSLDETRAYVAARVDQPEWRGWAITQKGRAGAIGTLWAGEQPPGVVEIGYLLDHVHWGQGYAREGVSALIDVIFAQGARRVYADTDTENAASIRLLELLGFLREGVLRADWETHLGVRDTLILGLLRDEWRRD